MAPKKSGSKTPNDTFINDILNYKADLRVNRGVTVAELAEDGITWKPLGKHVADKTAQPYVDMGFISKREANKITKAAYNEVHTAAKLDATIDVMNSLLTSQPVPAFFVPQTSFTVNVPTLPVMLHRPFGIIPTTTFVFNPQQQQYNPQQQQYNPQQQQYNPPQVLSKLEQILQESRDFNKKLNS
jgi:hypothetical protein